MTKNEAPGREALFAAAPVGLAVSVVCVALYRVFAGPVIRFFIAEPETVRLGTQFLQARCFATPFLFLSFHVVHFMQAVDRGPVSFWLAAIRQLGLNVPLLFCLNALFGMTGIIWTQAAADVINVVISYVIYARVVKGLAPAQRA